MARVLQIITMILALTPQIMQLIISIEETVRGSKQGITKKDMTTQILSGLTANIPIMQDPIAKQMMSNTIDSIVSSFNTSGIFKVTDPPDTPVHNP